MCKVNVSEVDLLLPTSLISVTITILKDVIMTITISAEDQRQSQPFQL